mmetsp:Transcript_42932/g.110842  ORF Transcript_42932/g.110842 Transcript_42932/m.110842 type:complete len:209 (-) Transcript_42932:1306-1932(-)
MVEKGFHFVSLQGKSKSIHGTSKLSFVHRPAIVKVKEFKGVFQDFLLRFRATNFGSKLVTELLLQNFYFPIAHITLLFIEPPTILHHGGKVVVIINVRTYLGIVIMKFLASDDTISITTMSFKIFKELRQNFFFSLFTTLYFRMVLCIVNSSEIAHLKLPTCIPVKKIESFVDKLLPTCIQASSHSSQELFVYYRSVAVGIIVVPQRF